MVTDSDTIAAIATPGGRGGIGIVKISGSDAFGIAQAIFRPLKNRPDAIGAKIRQGTMFDPSNLRPIAFTMGILLIRTAVKL
jgi:tRNA U34 5-carboxymethylaminomethyl modifying GTPase MnmE/TrmE